jgi:hypothetical protein
MQKVNKGWNKGYFDSPNVIFDHDNLTTYEKLCYLYMCRCADDQLQSFPSYATVAKKIGAKSRTTAINTVKSLEKKGYLKVKRRKLSKKENTSNLYTLVHPSEVIPSTGDVPPSTPDVLPPSTGDVPPSTPDVPNKYSLINPNYFINTQQQQENENRVVVVQEKYESLFQKKLTRKQAIDLVTLSDENEVDVIHKIENTYEMHKVEPRKSIIASVKRAITHGDWEITRVENKTYKPLPKAVQAQLDRKKGIATYKPKYTPEEIARKKAEIERKIALLHSDNQDAF